MVRLTAEQKGMPRQKTENVFPNAEVQNFSSSLCKP